jgi:hypothetical protein
VCELREHMIFALEQRLSALDLALFREFLQ